MNNYNNYDSRRIVQKIPKLQIDNVYYNMEIINSIRNNEVKRADFKETRTEVLLDNPSDYYLSIIRFSVPSSSIPIFIFRIQEGELQCDPDLGIYSVSLRQGATTHQAFLDYTADDLTQAVPNPPCERPTFGFTQDTTEYYFVNNYRTMITMINTAFQAAFDAFVPALVGVSEAPFLRFDSETQLLSLVVQNDYIAAGVDVFWNNPMDHFIEGMPALFFGFGTALGVDWQLILEDYQDNAYFKQLAGSPAPLTAAYLQFTQEFPTMQSWEEGKKIIFLSNTIPVRREFISNVNESGINKLLPILTDFEIGDREESKNARSEFNFNPTGPYRLIDLYGLTNIKTLDLEVAWIDTEGQRHPIFIQPGSAITVKVLFVKRELYKTELSEVQSSTDYY